MSRRDSAFVVIQRREHVLLVKSREKQRWQLPGGGMKPSETPWDAALREVDEETGLETRILALTGMYRRKDATLVFVFAGRVVGGFSRMGPRHEIAKQRWVRVRKALRLLSNGARRRLLDALGRPQVFRARATPLSPGRFAAV